MKIEFAEELEPRLTQDKTGLEIAGTYVPAADVLKSYLDRPYGNAYEFDQVEKIEQIF